MSIKNFCRFLLVLFATPTFVTAVLFTTAESAHAEYNGHRFGLGVGVAQLSDNKTYVAVGAEYEYRLEPMLGIGGFANYVFSTPGLTLIGLPMVYFHPLSNDWYINAAPIAQFGGSKTEYGVRLGTRIPIALGPVSIVPQASVDFIAGGRNLIFGLGIGI